MITIEIKNWLTGSVLFTHTAKKNTLKITLEAGVLARANLARARLDGASLVGASLDGASLDGASLVGASLVGARLDGASLVGASLVGANLDGANLARASLARASLVGARLDGANLAGARLVGASLVGASLDGASLVGATGNGREIMSFVALEYRGVYTAEFMWIGCRKHPVKTWWKDSEKEAGSFNSSQIAWREKHKKWISAMIKASPAIPTEKKS